VRNGCEHARHVIGGRTEELRLLVQRDAPGVVIRTGEILEVLAIGREGEEALSESALSVRHTADGAAEAIVADGGENAVVDIVAEVARRSVRIVARPACHDERLLV